jgi:hypothetical protein
MLASLKKERIFCLSNLCLHIDIPYLIKTSSFLLLLRIIESTIKLQAECCPRAGIQINQSQYANMATKHSAERKFRASLS